ncbi:MAG TPA: TolC family protein, partial [Candidatus Kapabacteria bacterium]|nr:TolC family protein [Candidatus Kapabacteria bacterium]
MNFEILQSARPMLSFRNLGVLVAASGLGAIAQTNSPVTGLPPTAAVPTNSVNLTATNFIAGGLTVTNGALAGYSSNNVPPTSILGSNIVVRPVTLAEVIDLALRNNYDIQFARLNPDIARHNLEGAYGIYDPVFNFGYEYSFRSQPGGFDEQGRIIPSREVSGDTWGDGGAMLSGYAPTGLRYNFGLNADRDKSGGVQTDVLRDLTGSPFATNTFFGEDVSYSGGVGVRVTQPLLRDFWIDQPRATIKINKKRLQITEWQLRAQLMTTVALVESSYYDLIRARENIKVQRAALEYNNQLLRENKKRVEVGALAPLDEKQAEAEVARGVAALLQTEQGYALALNNLKNLITQDFPSVANVVLDPMETLVAVPSHPELAESWRLGLTMRPEIQQSKLDLEARDINLKFLKNQIWPALDLVGTYGQSSINSDYGRALEDLTRMNNERYSYGVVLSIPIGNRSARSTYKAQKASNAQALIDYKALEQDIMVSIDNAIKLLQS